LQVAIPKKIPFLENPLKFTKIVCGGMHTLALTSDGLVYSWGASDDGALGRSGPEENPGLVTTGNICPITDISAGDCHSIAYNSELGKVYMWGVYKNLEHETKVNPVIRPILIGESEFRKRDIMKVCSGAHHTLYLVDGAIFATGDIENLNLGPRVEKEKLDITENHPQLFIIDKPKKINRWVDIFVGNFHSFAINEIGELFAWGRNAYGQLGTGDFLSSRNLRKIKDFDAQKIKNIVGGEGHSVALMDNGELYSWGLNNDNQLGFSEAKISSFAEQAKKENWIENCIPLPTKIEGVSNITKISAGTHFTYGIDSFWKLYAWGFGENYVLGNKSDDNIETPTETLTKFTEKNHIVDVFFTDFIKQ